MIKPITRVLLLTLLYTSTINSEPQLQPIYDLITRTTPSIASYFYLKYILHPHPSSSFNIYYSSSLNKIILEGTDNISLCKAYNTYLE